MKTFTLLEKRLGRARIGKEVDLSPYVTIRTKATAEFFFEAKTREDVIASVKAARELSLPYFILGGGTNLAITSPYLKGLVVRNRYLAFLYKKETAKGVELLVSSGYPMPLVVKRTIDDGYEGFEYQMGLPGTVGGGLYMNSKWTKPLSYIGDHLVRAELLDRDGRVREVDRSYFQFGYDTSALQETKEILLTATFGLASCPTSTLKKRALDALAYRKKTQPFGVQSSGCFFQNISEESRLTHHLPTTSAGYLIDKAGLKGRRVGEFVVSEKHANFILNEGAGRPEDLVSLLTLIKNTVKEKFGITLTPEVVIV